MSLWTLLLIFNEWKKETFADNMHATVYAHFPYLFNGIELFLLLKSLNQFTAREQITYTHTLEILFK